MKMISVNDIEMIAGRTNVPYAVKVKNITRTSNLMNKMRQWCEVNFQDDHFYSRGDFMFTTIAIRDQFVATFVAER
jgi:hypothetical protein